MSIWAGGTEKGTNFINFMNRAVGNIMLVNSVSRLSKGTTFPLNDEILEKKGPSRHYFLYNKCLEALGMANKVRARCMNLCKI